MRERPILFSGPLVRAILDGRKTQTRRPVRWLPQDGAFLVREGWPYRSRDAETFYPWNEERPYKSPFGTPGDQLWVRETFMDKYGEGDLLYRADLDHCGQCLGYSGRPPRPGNAYLTPKGNWTPSIHMPRWASRLTLQVTGIRVERVRFISKEDAHAEGVQPAECRSCGGRGWFDNGALDQLPCECQCEGGRLGQSYIWGFAAAWDAIYGNKPGLSWTENPWVWVVDFKRVEVSP